MAKPKNQKLKKNKPKNVGRKKSFPFSKNALRRISKAGLPDPTPHTNEEFIRLQKQWYGKLAAEGFDDIEWVDHKTGMGHDSAYLKGSLALGRTYHPHRALYFDLANNYLQHCGGLRGFNRFVWKMHASGETYDSIIAAIKKKYKSAPSKYTLFYLIQKIAGLCYKWNCKNKEGLFVKRMEDRQKIAESHLAEIIASEYNWIIGEDFL